MFFQKGKYSKGAGVKEAWWGVPARLWFRNVLLGHDSVPCRRPGRTGGIDTQGKSAWMYNGTNASVFSGKWSLYSFGWATCREWLRTGAMSPIRCNFVCGISFSPRPRILQSKCVISVSVHTQKQSTVCVNVPVSILKFLSSLPKADSFPLGFITGKGKKR